MLASAWGHPINQGIRAPSDRGRYPEEAEDEEPQREDTPSDGEPDETFFVPGEGIPFSKPTTPAPSVMGDESGMSLSVPESPGFQTMDIDMVWLTLSS
jgi:hypothetical protein